jgi:predicted lysophospholipase L1 biosynthesis ABC-type transport system permease subunit
MAWPVALDMRDGTLAAAVQAGVVARADARVCRVEIVECCGKRRQVVLGRLAVPTLERTPWWARYQLGFSSVGLIVLARVRVWILDQGHCRSGTVLSGPSLRHSAQRLHFYPAYMT